MLPPFQRPFSLAALPLVVLMLSGAATAQSAAQKADGALSGNIKYNSGQSIQPIFEGWTRNADGGYQLWFGYLNRNHVEEIGVPVGPNNRIEPGGPDRGQPTYFYTRFNRQLFSVTAPRDFGEKAQVIWTVAANGQTERAVGWLRPDWEIAPPGTGTGSGRGGEAAQNQPPTLTVSGATTARVAAPFELTATVTDDGLPPTRGRSRDRTPNPRRAPAFDNPEFKSTVPTNVPQVERPVPPRVDARLQVTWLVWRGPASVTFNPPVAGADEGKAVVTATFTKPGDYILRARVTDGAASTMRDIKVVVTGQQP
ncbi:MAG: hypothetical protein DMF89_19445 [Acidobacteria bacterium]|nr:MAG: hypothetical protein DMF90_07105 [Acidobacteriota bacterium]PYR47260.1 MAG: hypothetical protein DMF89_19445 [Acidobacteriota bacterium]